MEITYLVKGFIIGLSVAAPVGPIGVLTIKRTLAEGRLSGFITGMGAACADAVYGAIAGFGLLAISSFLLAHGFIIQLAGGLFLSYLGLKSYFSKPATHEATAHAKGLFNKFMATFFLTLTNPATLLSFFAIFASVGLVSTTVSYLTSSAMVLGVWLGSALWWFILSGIVSYFRGTITPARLVWVNRISGVVFLTFGVYILYALYQA